MEQHDNNGEKRNLNKRREDDVQEEWIRMEERNEEEAVEKEGRKRIKGKMG